MHVVDLHQSIVGAKYYRMVMGYWMIVLIVLMVHVDVMMVVAMMGQDPQKFLEKAKRKHHFLQQFFQSKTNYGILAS